MNKNLLLYVSLTCVVIHSMGATSAADAPAKMPSLAAVQKTVETELAKLPNYQPGDLISRNQVEPVFAALAKQGWKVAEAKEILARVPADNEYFVSQMRTTNGRKFMRDIAKYPLAYDRIDRITAMPMGQQNLRAFIRGPDGYKMIQYMTTTSGGKNMGNMLANGPGGADFNSPTGRIYTADALLRELTQAFSKKSAAVR